MVPFMQFGTVQDRGLTPAQAAVVMPGMDPALTHAGLPQNEWNAGQGWR